MADNKIQGRAKKYDGTAIDYVQIFNWVDGKCISQVVPDASGNWQYTYSKDLQVGLTYVADGCESITHGAYDFDYVYDPLNETILHYSFNGDVLDQSANALDGIKTGSANFVAGRKEGTQALEFSGGQVVTPNVLPINSNVLVMSFWIATTSVADSVIFETSADAFSNPNNTLIGLNDPNQSTINSVPVGTTANINVSRSPMKTDGTWQHCIISIDRTAAQELKNRIYIDNVETTQLSEFIDPLVGNFANDVLFVGRRGSGAKPMFAKVQDVRFYNRVLTDDERFALFNE